MLGRKYAMFSCNRTAGPNSSLYAASIDEMAAVMGIRNFFISCYLLLVRKRKTQCEICYLSIQWCSQSADRR